MPFPLISPITQRLKNTIKAMGLKEAVLRFSYRKGLPPSLDEEKLRRIVADKTGDSLKSVAYRQMSGWKKSGAYRLVLRTTAGAKLSLVFKNALYSGDEIPALEGLPITPGLGEYTFFKRVNGDLARFLPAVFLAEEVIKGKHYQYIMEDLTVQYRSYAGEADFVTLCQALPDVHAAFGALGSDPDFRQLPKFDYDFADKLLAYSKQSLDAYRKTQPAVKVDNLLDNWQAFSTKYRKSAEAVYGEQPLILIHGDSNTGNVMFPKQAGPIKLVDFEWAGWGLPHHDLAVALHRAPKEIEAVCVEAFSRSQGLARLEKDWNIYRHCRIERALLDASFIARQMLNAEARTPKWFPEFIGRSCNVSWELSQALRVESL